MPLPPLPPAFDPEKEFPILKHLHFFNHSGVSPLSLRATDALRQYADEIQNFAYTTGHHYKKAERVRQAAATIINADPSEIAFIKNTSEGIAFVANGLTWNAGDEIISTAVEYPSNVYPWMDLQKRFGAKHIMIPETTDARIDTHQILNAVTPRTRMIALSHVEYASGYRNDLHTIGTFCRANNIRLCVDAIQSIGCIPVDVKAMNIDYLSADGHKWMLGPEGLGFFYCRKELIESLQPEVGWMNVINATDYGNFDFTFRSDARRFECGSYNIPGILALGASLELLLEIGVPTLWARIKALTDLLAEGLIQKGYHTVSPRQTESESSGILSFTSPTLDQTAIVKNLEDQKIILVQRERRLRAAPHFYQSEANIHALLVALPSH